MTRAEGRHSDHLFSSLFEQRDLPNAGWHIVPQNVPAAITAPNLEVAVVPARPAIKDLNDPDATISQEKRARYLFVPVAL